MICRQWIVFCLGILSALDCSAEGPSTNSVTKGNDLPSKPNAIVGAYYFDGWTAQHDQINKTLYAEFPHRQPVWGWKDDTIEIMRKQIEYCADYGISF